MNIEALARGQRFIDEHEKLEVLCKEMIETLTDELRNPDHRKVRRSSRNEWRPFGPVNRAWTLDKWKERFKCLI